MEIIERLDRFGATVKELPIEELYLLKGYINGIISGREIREEIERQKKRDRKK